MADLKREYVVPLRRKTRTAPKWRRSKKAVSVLNDFIKKHMKTETVVLCPELNDKIWENGIKNPPGKVSVVALKTKIGEDEKTLVNLTEVGVDAQLKLYQQAQPVAPKAEDAKADSSEVVDVEGKEIEKKPTEDKKETKAEAKKEKAPVKKAATKKEAKKE